MPFLKQPTPVAVEAAVPPTTLLGPAVVEAIQLAWLSLIVVLLGALWMSHAKSSGVVAGRAEWDRSPWPRCSKMWLWPRDVYETAAINILKTSPPNLFEIVLVLGCGYLYFFVPCEHYRAPFH